MLIIQMDIETPNVDEIDEKFREAIEEGLDELAEEVEWVWRQKASAKLVESKKKFLDGLSVERVGNEIQVVLKGYLAAAIEGGAPEQDLKKIFGMGRIVPMGHPPASSSAWFHEGRQMPRFRTVTNASPWKHPGIKPGTSGSNPNGMTINEEVQKVCDESLVDEVLDRVFSKLSI